MWRGTALKAAKVKVIREQRPGLTQQIACDMAGISPRRYRDIRTLPEVTRLANGLRNRPAEEWWDEAGEALG